MLVPVHDEPGPVMVAAACELAQDARLDVVSVVTSDAPLETSRVASPTLPTVKFAAVQETPDPERLSVPEELARYPSVMVAVPEETTAPWERVMVAVPLSAMRA